MACTSASTATIRVDRASSLSQPDRFAERRSVELLPTEREALEYDVLDESFELLTPDAGEPSALLVSVSAGRSGSAPSDWLPILRSRRIAWLGPNRSGNRRSPVRRVQLALDAARYLRERYPGVSCYVAGFSGGARIASELAILYPDVFAGGLLFAAADSRSISNRG